MKDNYSDDGRDFGHFESIALNAMMINYQLKNNSKKLAQLKNSLYICKRN